MPRLKTGISEVRWCDPRAGYAFEKANIGQPSAAPVSWLDRLLGGGIVLPESCAELPSRALTILINGPPGTGKTTLAAELCMNLAGQRIREDDPDSPTWRSIYVTTESIAPWFIENAVSYRWSRGRFFDAEEVNAVQPVAGGVYVISTSPKLLDAEGGAALPPGGTIGIWAALQHFFEPARAIERLFPPHAPAEVLVIDSLNTIPFNASKHFSLFTQLIESGPRLLVVVQDSVPARASRTPPFWEYISDIVLSLDSSREAGYQLRTIEVVKARYQSHVWGRHQLKIYEPPDPYEPTATVERNRLRMRGHPFATHGGVFIFPSIHAHLSGYKRKMPDPNDQLQYLDSRIDGLREMLGRGEEGYPQARCTALLGERGGHKSRLGYLELLGNLLDPDPAHLWSALVVSLRDDEGVTQQDLRKVLGQVVGQLDRNELIKTLLAMTSELADGKGGKDLERRLNDLVRQLEGLHVQEEVSEDGKRTVLDALQDLDRLEIMYSPPGYITPDEFFHRVLISIHRLKRERRNLLMLFNSLDQLSSRFPLCAKEEMFVPGLVAMLSAEEVTSFFVSASEGGPGIDYAGTGRRHYGLEAVAELILDFRRGEGPLDSFLAAVAGSLENVAQRGLTNLNAVRGQAEGKRHQTVVVRVQRFAGGTSAGSTGTLELVGPGHPLFGVRDGRDDSKTLFQPGLHFVPDASWC